MTNITDTTDADSPRRTPAVHWLLALNAAVFFLQFTVLRASDIQQALGFQTKNLGHQWWTIVSYVFVHSDTLLFALTMYALWLFGPRVERQWGTRDFLRFYLTCTLGGWFAFLAFVGGDATFTGAAAPVFGVMLAYVSLWADDTALVFGTVATTVRWLAMFVGALIAVTGIIPSSSGGGTAFLAHGGGLIAAWLYLRMTSPVSIARLRQGVSQVPDEPDDVPPRAVPKTAPKSRAREREQIDDVVAQSQAASSRNVPAVRPLRSGAPDGSALDRVLDKISAHGIGSLSPEERRLLDEASKRMRDE